jgi:hypothetical protein
MTQQVIECHAWSLPADSKDRPGSRQTEASARGFKAALITGVLALVASVSFGQPASAGPAAVTVASILLLHRLSGGRARWGWLALLTAAAQFLLVPRPQSSAAATVLFVASWMFLVLWLVQRGTASAGTDDRPRPASPDRQAQLLMGFSGERQVSDTLARDLPDDFVLVNGLKLPHGAGDIDHLVVGPTGVFLLETKMMAGRIECAPDGTWRRIKRGRGGTDYAAFIGDPVAQVLRNVHAVRDCLHRRTPRLFHGAKLWINGLIVFAHPEAHVAAEHSRVPAVGLHEAALRICTHSTGRPLDAQEIKAIVGALLNEAQARPKPMAQSAQALVETAIALPIVLVLLFGIVAVSRIVQAQTAVVAIAEAGARAGSFGKSPHDANQRVSERAYAVADGLGLDRSALDVVPDASRFGRDGEVTATVSYTVSLGDIPLPGLQPQLTVRAQHVEWLDPFRSGLGVLVGEGE